MERKFRRITAPFLTPQGQDRVLDLLRGDLERPMSQVVERVNRALGL